VNILLRLTNNIVINQLLIWLGLDTLVLSRLGMYHRIRLDEKLSPQEMAGFSKRKKVQEAINKTHFDLQEVVNRYLQSGDRILDIGCGPGTYLKDFDGKYQLTGIDINQQMIDTAHRNVKDAHLIRGDFMNFDFEQKYKLIYSVSVLEFIPPSQLRAFFRKVHHLLEPDGILFLHYPHALKYIDTLYPDLYYIEYSPRKVERELKNNFKVVKHQHGFDGRKIDLFDTKPYEPGIRTFKNGYLLVAMRKGSPNV
jgi:SAM-dependent methyltransferase